MNSYSSGKNEHRNKISKIPCFVFKALFSCLKSCFVVLVYINDCFYKCNLLMCEDTFSHTCSHCGRNRGKGRGGGCPPIFGQPKKLKSLKITTYKSVYSNKPSLIYKTIIIIAQWILEIADILMY